MKTLYILCIVNILLSFSFFLLKQNNDSSNFDYSKLDERFSSIENQINSLSFQSTNVVINQDTSVKPLLNIENTYSVPFTVAVLKKRPSVNFGGSSAIYFLGEFCPYGQILTITPNRILCKSGASFNMILPAFTQSVSFIPEDSSSGIDENQHASKPNFNFFGAFE